jgi:hypothetical protein
VTKIPKPGKKIESIPFSQSTRNPTTTKELRIAADVSNIDIAFMVLSS